MQQQAGLWCLLMLFVADEMRVPHQGLDLYCWQISEFLHDSQLGNYPYGINLDDHDDGVVHCCLDQSSRKRKRSTKCKKTCTITEPMPWLVPLE